MIILIILIILVLLSFNLFRNLFKSDVTILDDVKLKESEPSNNGFALMLETENEDGTTSYVESNSSTWPTDMKFNSELSGCIDVNGNIIKDALEYDSTNNIMNVSVGETAYCYVYFDMDKSLNNKVVNSSDIWDMTAEVGINVMDVQEYRYVGTNPSNNICFGTSDKDTCLGDTDKYMYRIIGVFEGADGSMHTKLIKKETLNTAYAWYSDETIDVDWNNSDLYKGINGSYFLTNTSYQYMQDTTWTDKIAIWNYTMTNTKSYDNYSANSVFGPYYFFSTGKSLYLHELNRNGKSSETCYWNNDPTIADCTVGEWKPLSTKISLMYASDYALSLGSDALNYIGYLNRSTLKTGWMHISNNDSERSSSNEWTMSRFGKYNNYNAWHVNNTGSLRANVYAGYVSTANAVRPVFYLTSDAEILGGTGTSNDPFLLKVD